MRRLTRRAVFGVIVTMVRPGEQAAVAAQATPVPAPGDARDGVPVSVLIQNSGMTADRLTWATSTVAQEITLHETHLDHGQRVMRQVSELVIPAASVISLEPGTRHLMLNGLLRSLVQGRIFPLTLHFADAGDVRIDVRIRRKQDAAGVPETAPTVAGSLSILHASAPPAPASPG